MCIQVFTLKERSKPCLKIKKEERAMATSSIFHNFVISGSENVQRFIDAIEESEKLKEENKDLKKIENFKIGTKEDIIRIMERRKKKEESQD